MKRLCDAYWVDRSNAIRLEPGEEPMRVARPYCDVIEGEGYTVTEHHTCLEITDKSGQSYTVNKPYSGRSWKIIPYDHRFLLIDFQLKTRLLTPPSQQLEQIPFRTAHQFGPYLLGCTQADELALLDIGKGKKVWGSGVKVRLESISPFQVAGRQYAMATAQEDGEAFLFGAVTGQRRSFGKGHNILHFELAQVGEWPIMIAHSASKIHLWNPISGRPIRQFERTENYFYFKEDGRRTHIEGGTVHLRSSEMLTVAQR